MRACYLSTSAATVTTTVASVPNLSFTATAGATYRITFCANLTIAGTTGDVFYTWLGGTATATMTAYHVIISTAPTGATSASLASAVLNPTTATFTGATMGTTGTVGVVMYGTVTINASGTLAAQVIKTGTASTLTVPAGAVMLAERLI